jgi:hypothetical protein
MSEMIMWLIYGASVFAVIAVPITLIGVLTLLANIATAIRAVVQAVVDVRSEIEISRSDMRDGFHLLESGPSRRPFQKNNLTIEEYH